ncbi:hypothetical protein ACWF7H_23350 [Peribacillus butanolivorans]
MASFFQYSRIAFLNELTGALAEDRSCLKAAFSCVPGTATI